MDCSKDLLVALSSNELEESFVEREIEPVPNVESLPADESFEDSLCNHNED